MSCSLPPTASLDDLAGRADLERWRPIGELGDDRKVLWRRRAHLAGRLAKPDSRVLDLGCGEMLLESELSRPRQYTPSDCVARDGRTVVRDYNIELPPSDSYDYVFALGVAEYVTDPGRFFTELTRYQATLIFTYHPAERWQGPPPHQLGWPTLLRTAEVQIVLQRAGYIIIAQCPSLPSEHLYVAIPSPIRFPE